MSSALVENNSLTPPVCAVTDSPLKKLVTLADRITVAPWKWLAVTFVLLAASGSVRIWRDMQFRAISRESTACPFSLKTLPHSIGRWHAVEGSEVELDPEIARIAGSSEHLIRSYRDTKSGEIVSVLVLYGLAEGVFGHTPEVCYPAAGYQPMNIPPKNRVMELPISKKPLEFRTAYFGKQIAGMPNCVEVLWTFRYNGDWLPDVSKRWKSFRSHPGMFKIQIQRLTCEQGAEERSTDSLIKDLGDEIEQGVAQRDGGLRKQTPATP